MVELFGLYALLLAGWGLWRHRREVTGRAVPAESAVTAGPEPAGPARERGAAARRHLNSPS